MLVVKEVLIASVVIFVEVAIDAGVLVGDFVGALLPALVTESAGHISAK